MPDTTTKPLPADLATIAESLAATAAIRPDAPAFTTADATVSYAALQGQIAQTGEAVRASGVAPGDGVAILLRDGVDLAMTVTAIACHAAALPLNPCLTTAELDDLFGSPRVKAVILADDAGSAAGAEAAERRGLPVFLATGTGGTLALSPPRLPAARATRDPQARDAGPRPDDLALILRTSGTVGRPKLVPVTHRNLCATAEAIRLWFDLTPADRVLCGLPFYYAVGLKVALFTTLLTGGSVAAVEPARGDDFIAAIGALQPSWYSASPTSHQAIFERARTAAPDRLRHALRFIHSGAAALPDALHDGLEALFGVPVLQTYGLSEVGLVAANSPAPDRRKRGTVGRPRPGELAIRDDHGRLLGIDEPGEIMVRGPSVTPGYLDDPAANEAVFREGWFCSGDLGRIDRDGFLTVIGRIKEMINRGGEKILPAEIDEALLRHAAVRDAAAFALPHPRLGEDVAAAVVLRSGADTTVLELRRFLRSILAPHKIPRRIFIVEDIPRGETGKVRRHELAQGFDRDVADKDIAGRQTDGVPQSSPWASPLEVEIGEIWQRLLRVDEIKASDEFFERGGDSLLAAQMLIEIERLTGRVLSPDILFESATLHALAESIIRSDTTGAENLMVEIQPGTGQPPFFFVDGDFWGGGYYTRKIAQLLGPEYPFYDLRSHGLRGDRIPSIEEMARDYLRLITAKQPHGPYRLGGHCNGALIAWEIARQVESMGERVDLVVLIEPITLNTRAALRLCVRSIELVLKGVTPDRARRGEQLGIAMSALWRIVRRASERGENGHRRSSVVDDLDALAQKIRQFDVPGADRYEDLLRQYRRIMARYLPPPIDANVLCLIASSHRQNFAFSAGPCRGWASRCEVETIPGDHMTCITTHAEAVTSLLRARLRALDTVTSA